MPYKIYTYEDPYKLDQTDFWDEISILPHFCVSRTLVNGLRDVLGDRIKGLLCPLDEFVQHEGVYKSWTDNISLRIKQFSALTAVFKDLLDRQVIDKSFHQALTQNQNHFLEAMRLFIELGISADVLDKEQGNKEQQLFIHLLDRSQKKELFRFPELRAGESGKMHIHDVLVNLAENEVKDCRGTDQDKKRCVKAYELTKQHEFDAVVVHGVHQFTPTQIRLLIALERLGFTIIFLFNYQKKYSKIYSSWKDIYNCFDVKIHHDTAIPEYQMDTMQNPSNALACALGAMCEGNLHSQLPSFKQWHQLYNAVDFVEFANITEYAHFVSSHFKAAEERYAQSRKIMERGNDVWNKTAVLREMEEQVYTANRDVHTLLKIYHPDYAHDRHFLAYPIGQFFAAIYRIWDYERGEILFDVAAIKECLNSNVLQAAPAEELLRTFYNLELLFEQVATYSDFEQMIGRDFLANYDRVVKAKGTDSLAVLKDLSVYNRYKVRRQDVVKLIEAIKELNDIARELFALDDSHEDYISFGDHFRKLEKFLKQRELTLANAQERALIMALQLRLEQIKPERSNFSGTFRDLSQGLHYYLKQKESQDEGAGWIVKNFEQIDGDILQSKRQFIADEHKVYHFACLSDRDMNQTVNDLLPWPLTDEFIRAAYAPVDLQFQVYYTTLGTRSQFLRYALFYGLCFNCCDVRLSYVKQYDNEITECFALLSILGFSPKGRVVEEPGNSLPDTINIRQTPTRGVRYDRYEMMDMFLCPYRFFLDYVMGDKPVIQGNFLYQKYYENLLVEAVWRRIANTPIQLARQVYVNYLVEESDKLKPFFPFWKDTEIYDLRKRAQNYLLNEVIKKSRGNKVNPFAESHMRMRKIFGAALYSVNIADVELKHPYPKFEALAQTKYPSKVYSLHKVPKPDNQAQVDGLCDETRQYLNNADSNDRNAIASDWCTYCVHRGTCMEPFLAGKK